MCVVSSHLYSDLSEVQISGYVPFVPFRDTIIAREYQLSQVCIESLCTRHA